jgi:hypothetical protein
MGDIFVLQATHDQFGNLLCCIGHTANHKGRLTTPTRRNPHLSATSGARTTSRQYQRSCGAQRNSRTATMAPRTPHPASTAIAVGSHGLRGPPAR